MVRKVRALLDGADPSQVAAGMRRSATLRRIERRAPVDDCAAYMLKLAPYLRYGAALREGLPIATGVIEGACRHLIRRRLDIGGARWGTEGAEAVLLLRAVILSGDYDAYWEFHRHAMFGRVHASRYRGDVPNTNPSRPGLRCVKLAGFASVVKELLPTRNTSGRSNRVARTDCAQGHPGCYAASAAHRRCEKFEQFCETPSDATGGR